VVRLFFCLRGGGLHPRNAGLRNAGRAGVREAGGGAAGHV